MFNLVLFYSFFGGIKIKKSDENLSHFSWHQLLLATTLSLTEFNVVILYDNVLQLQRLFTLLRSLGSLICCTCSVFLITMITSVFILAHRKA